VAVARTKLTLAVVLVAGAAAANVLRFAEPSRGSTLGLAGLRLETGGEAFAESPLDPGFLEVLRAEEVMFRTYGPETDAPVWVFLGYFDRQKEGSQVHSPRHCYPGSGWSVVEEARVQAPWGGDRIRELTVTNGAQTRVVYYWFQTPEGVIDNVFALKLHMTRCALARRPQQVVFVRVSTPLAQDPAGSRLRLGAYANALVHEVERLYGLEG